MSDKIDNVSSNFLITLKKAIKCLTNEKEINLLIKHINKNIRMVTKTIKNKLINSGNFSKLEKNLSLLKFYKEQLKLKKKF